MILVLSYSVGRLMDEGSHYSAYILAADAVDIRLLCKRFRRKCRKYLGGTPYKIVWVRVRSGVLLLCSGAPVVADVLQSFLETGYFEECRLYRGASREAFTRKVDVALYDYVKKSRSYGGSR